jgi:hypothetical protein
MTDWIVLALLVHLAAAQTAWCLYYGFRYSWRETRLGPVWLAKGTAFAITWWTFLVDQFWDVPAWIWAFFNGPLLVIGTTWWLVVTVRVRREQER